MILSYSIISSVILGFCYLAYRIFMAGKRQHAVNRSVLLLSYAVSLTVPIAILIAIFHTTSIDPETAVIKIGEISNELADGNGKANPEDTLSIDFISIIYKVYFSGLVIVGCYYLFGLAMLWRLIRKGERKEFGNFTLILVDDSYKTAPFNWKHTIVMRKADYEGDGDMILIHEYAHLKLCHWADLLVAYTTICLQWYNPAAWAMREELRAIHEYQADESVIESGVNPKEYQMLLLKRAVGYGYQSLANSLNHSKLQKRVTMMYNKKTSLRRRLFALALIPAIGAGIAVTSIPSVAGVLKSIAEASVVNPDSKITPIPDETTKEREVFVAVQDQAEFPGGMPELMHWLADHVNYPKEAEKAGVQGRVIIKFIIEADGTVTNPQIVKGVSPELDKEAMRLVRAMPKWTPARNNGTNVASYFTIPIAFWLKKDTPTEETN